jgi:hypothetical protein
MGEFQTLQIWTRGGSFRRRRQHYESRVAVAVVRGQFGNPGRGTSAVGSRYQRTCVRQQTEKAKCVYNELQTDFVKYQ